jgi:hypothetical protein
MPPHRDERHGRERRARSHVLDCPGALEGAIASSTNGHYGFIVQV